MVARAEQVDKLYVYDELINRLMTDIFLKFSTHGRLFTVDFHATKGSEKRGLMFPSPGIGTTVAKADR